MQDKDSLRKIPGEVTEEGCQKLNRFMNSNQKRTDDYAQDWPSRQEGYPRGGYTGPAPPSKEEDEARADRRKAAVENREEQRKRDAKKKGLEYKRKWEPYYPRKEREKREEEET